MNYSKSVKEREKYEKMWIWEGLQRQRDKHTGKALGNMSLEQTSVQQDRDGNQRKWCEELGHSLEAVVDHGLPCSCFKMLTKARCVSFFVLTPVNTNMCKTWLLCVGRRGSKLVRERTTLTSMLDIHASKEVLFFLLYNCTNAINLPLNGNPSFNFSP